MQDTENQRTCPYCPDQTAPAVLEPWQDKHCDNPYCCAKFGRERDRAHPEPQINTRNQRVQCADCEDWGWQERELREIEPGVWLCVLCEHWRKMG